MRYCAFIEISNCCEQCNLCFNKCVSMVMRRPGFLGGTNATKGGLTDKCLRVSKWYWLVFHLGNYYESWVVDFHVWGLPWPGQGCLKWNLEGKVSPSIYHRYSRQKWPVTSSSRNLREHIVIDQTPSEVQGCNKRRRRLPMAQLGSVIVFVAASGTSLGHRCCRDSPPLFPSILAPIWMAGQMQIIGQD